MKRETLIIILVLLILGVIALSVFLIFQSKGDKDVAEDDALDEQETSDDCADDTYNCDDFDTQEQAQEMFESCGGTNNDVHRLDSDKDGIVCEGLG